jgi:hypothetical protein
MRTHRLSIGLLMSVVAMLAFDFALIRFALAYRGPDLAATYGPIGLASQVGLLIAARRPTGRRGFWVGLVSGGLCASVGSAWLELARPGLVVDLWVKYLALLDSLFGRLPRLGAGNPGHDLVHFAVVTAFFFPAQLLLAFAGGILATGWGRADAARSGRVAGGQPV